MDMSDFYKIKVLDDLTAKVLAVANSELLNHEQRGAKEIAIFKSGVTL